MRLDPMPQRSWFSRRVPSRAYAEAIAAHVESQAGTAATMPRQVGLQSPLSDQSALQAVVWGDLTGQDAAILSRDAAMTIPALARQRHILCGTAARCPLVELIGDTRVPHTNADGRPQAHWSTRTDGTLSPYHRMLWTMDDLIHHGWAVWRTQRGSEGQLLNASRVPTDRWEDDEAGRIMVDGEVMDSEQVIAIPGPHEGILNFGRRALRRVIDNLEAAANAARNPSAYLELHYVGDEDLTDTEVDTHIARWAKARRGENAGVAWTNKLLELREHGTHESHLLIEGRNADAVDVSRLMSSPAAMADATSSGASLTYETTEGRNAQMLDYGAGFYMDAIAARLSMDDAVPSGHRIAFDTAQLRDPAPNPTGAPTDD